MTAPINTSHPPVPNSKVTLNAGIPSQDRQHELDSGHEGDGQYRPAGDGGPAHHSRATQNPSRALRKEYDFDEGGDPMLGVYELNKRRMRSFEDKLRSHSVDSMRQLDRVQLLDAAAAALNKALYRFPADAKGTDKLDSTPEWANAPSKSSADATGTKTDQGHPLEREINTALINAGITSPNLSAGKGKTDLPGEDLDGGLNGSTTKADIDQMLAKLKGMSQKESSESNIAMVDLNKLTSDLSNATTMASTIQRKDAEMKQAILRALG